MGKGDELKVDSKWFPDFEKKLPDLTGKRIAITGTTSGTGQVAALTCLKKGAEVFILNRESERAQAALKALQEACPGRPVHHITCDLMDFASVREAARQLHVACQGRLDVLCNNAGIMAVPDAATKDGCCIQMQTNHLAHFLLTKEMHPALQAAAEQSGEARIVNHSSVARIGPKLRAENIQKKGGKLGGNSLIRYQQSKLANILFTYELADRLKPKKGKVKAVACAPGTAATSLLHSREGCCTMQRFVRFWSQCVWQSAEGGTMPLLTCIADPKVESGDFFTPSQCFESRGPVRLLRRPGVETECQDKESQALLWKESELTASEQFKI